jgi:hypothetical protein
MISIGYGTDARISKELAVTGESQPIYSVNDGK